MNRVLITGASSGIGEALAHRFAAEGFGLILTARRQDRLEKLRQSLEEQTEVNIFGADLATDDGLAALISDIDDADLGPDILVNNAGMMVQTEFAQLTPEQIDRTLALNIHALTRLTHHFLPQMLANKSGRILNVASVAAFHPAPGMDVYAATKAYVLSFTESLAENLRGTGVSVTALCPGATSTEMVDETLAKNLPPFMMSSAEDVAKEGFDALMNREVIRVPGHANKLALAWAQHQPRWLIRGLGGLASRFTR